MSEILSDDTCILLLTAALLIFTVVFSVEQLRWCNEGMRTLKQIDKELSELSDEPPKEET